ncbi:MAG: hypothetical protein IJ795_05620 [Bacteroidales bacterium]|nr:hypothetical protein [Bacteroidales bacterium]
MKRTVLTLTMVALCVAAFAQDKEAKVKVGGFIRNYAAFDTRVSYTGGEDFFYYAPKDVSMSGDEDMNAVNSIKFAALTTRLWVTAAGYEWKGYKFDARVEFDFYLGLSNTYTGAASCRFRQGWVRMSKDNWGLTVGQAWHPIAADLAVSVASMNSGTPYHALGRSPQIQWNQSFNEHWSYTISALAQMQFASAGPYGQVANYAVWGMIPEVYVGLNYKNGPWLMRIGGDVVSIKPRIDDRASIGATGTMKVNERLTTFTTYLYAQYKKDKFAFNTKLHFGQDGSHLMYQGGYGISGVKADGISYEYTPTQHFTGFVSALYGKTAQVGLLLGYWKNFGTTKALMDNGAGQPVGMYFRYSGDPYNMYQSFRVMPSFMYNMGKFVFSLELELDAVQYGDKAQVNLAKGLCEKNLHWVMNPRVISMVKYTF